VTKIRGLLLVSAFGCLVYGAWRLWSVGVANLLSAVKWLIGGVVVHDGVLAPAVVITGVLMVRLLPRWSRAPLIVAGIVLGSVTLLAIPVLGRYGALPDNPSLLDRPYVAGWLVLAALVLASAAVAAIVLRAREKRPVS